MSAADQASAVGDGVIPLNLPLPTLGALAFAVIVGVSEALEFVKIGLVPTVVAFVLAMIPGATYWGCLGYV